jgi:hypothetical protein
MAYQRSNAILVAIHRETAIAVQATATGATQVRITDSPGLTLSRAAVQSQEKRSDGLMTMGRLGYKLAEGSYNAEVAVGADTDLLLEAIARSVWSTAVAIGFATMTTVTVGTNQVVAAGGDWVTQGIRVGDIFRLAGYSTAADNDLNAPVIAVTSLTISVPTGTFTAGAADAAGTLTRLKKLTTGTTPTHYSHTVEQYEQDIDLSELFLGCRVVGVRLSFKPGAMVTATYTLMGISRTALAVGTSPYFTSPALSTTLGLIADDSAIRMNGAAVADFTGFDLDFQIAANGQPVIGSLATPDIFDNDLAVSGTITGLRDDFANLTLYDAETEFEVSILLEEPGSTPKNCLSIFLPRVKIAALSAPVGGGDGAKVETLGLMVGPKVAATGYDGSIVSISSSAA